MNADIYQKLQKFVYVCRCRDNTRDTIGHVCMGSARVGYTDHVLPPG